MPKMTDREKRVAKRKRERKKKWAPRKQLGIGFTIGLMLFIGLLTGVSLSIDTSVVNQLQQHTQTIRTNDMVNPIIISSDEGIMEIEVTLPNLNMIDNELDGSDLFCRFGRIENPIISVLDWLDRGQYLDDLYLLNDEYDDYCDSPDATNTYYTHFYIAWDTGFTIAEGYTYVLLLDFYDGDAGTDLHCCPALWDLMAWFGGEGPLTIRPTRPARPMMENALSINVDPEDPGEEDIQELLLECDYVSFFEYQAQEELAVTPTGTPTNGGNGGPTADGWFNQYDVLPNIQNGVVLLILILILGLLGLLIFFILFFLKKKKEDDKKDKKKKKKKTGKKK